MSSSTYMKLLFRRSLQFLMTRNKSFINNNNSFMKKQYYVLNCGRLNAKHFKKELQKDKQVTFNKNFMYIIASLSFLWPLKKVGKQIIEQIEDGNLCENADSLFENGHYEECYELLKQQEEQDVELKWRICRALYNMAKDSKHNKERKRELIDQAFHIISNQLSRHNDNYAVHKWYALLLDAKSTHEGIKERIKQLENVKKHMDIAVTLNPEDATTLHMLGEWCYQITEMPWHQRKIAEVLFATPPISSYEEALEYFLKAEAIQPRFYSLNLLRLGACYLKLDREDQAKYYLQLAASYPAKSNDDHLANKEAADLLKKLK